MNVSAAVFLLLVAMVFDQVLFYQLSSEKGEKFNSNFGYLHFSKAAARDLARYKPRGVLFPRPPSRNKKPIFPVKHTATINTRGKDQIVIQLLFVIFYHLHIFVTGFCGRENSTNSRIVGGTEAEPHSLPW